MKNLPKILICTDNGKLKNIKPVEIKNYSIDFQTFNNSHCLSEYSCVILDHINPINISPEKRAELINFVNTNDKCMVTILNKFKYTPTNEFDNYIHNSSILETNVPSVSYFSQESKGKDYKITSAGEKDVWGKYLNGVYRGWAISLKPGVVSNIIPLALNSNNDIVAFKVNSFPAHVYYLPLFEPDTLLYYILNTINNSKTTNVEEWVFKYTFNKLNESEANILYLSNKILELEEKKELEEIKRNNYEKIRNILLYCDGNILHEVCKDILNRIGILARDGVDGREDLVFEFKENHYT